MRAGRQPARQGMPGKECRRAGGPGGPGRLRLTPLARISSIGFQLAAACDPSNCQGPQSAQSVPRSHSTE
jgi:hypothetical protein